MTESTLNQQEPVVYVVDDEAAVLEIIRKILNTENIQVKTFQSGEDFLREKEISPHGCLVLDNMMPGLNGLDVQAELFKRGTIFPVLFISGASRYEDVVAAVRKGAVHFLQKPFSRREFLEHIRGAIAESERRLAAGESYAVSLTMVNSLTPREKEVYTLVTDGLTNRAISEELSISSGTVEFHRANLMKKLQASSLADLMEIRRLVRD